MMPTTHCVPRSESNTVLGEDSLPVVQKPISLRRLRSSVDDMASKEQIVLWRDGEGVACKDGRVHGEGNGHAAGDAVGSLVRGNSAGSRTIQSARETGEEGEEW
jgi:hypothetical protein